MKLPRFGPRSEMESQFAELQDAIVPPPARERPENQWISEQTWALIDNRARLRREGRLLQRAGGGMGRQINAALKGDRKQRADNIATDISHHLHEGDVVEALRCVKGWYRVAEDRAPKPCHESMEKQTKEREELYAKVPPPGDPIPINVDPFEINDAIPEDVEIRAVVRGMQNGRTAEQAEPPKSAPRT